MASLTRVAGAGAAAALVAALGGRALETTRFGAADADAAARIHTELQQRFDESAGILTGMAARAAEARPEIRAAARDGAALGRLFDIGESALPSGDRARFGITIYDAAGLPLAWAGRVSDLPRPRVGGPAALFVAPGALGPRLVLVAPLADDALHEGRQEATIVVEQLLADLAGIRGPGDTFVLATSLVPVTLRARIGRAAPPPADAFRFSITSPETGGTAPAAVLVDAEISPVQLTAARERWTRGAWGAASAVLVVTVLLCAGVIAEHRRRTRTLLRHAHATAALAGAVIAARLLVSVATFLLLGPHSFMSPTELAATGLALVAIVWLALDLVEQRRRARPRPRLLAPGRSTAVLLSTAYLIAGVVDTGFLLQYEGALRSIVSSTTTDLVHFSHAPLTYERLALAFALVLLHTGVIWMAAAVLRAPRLFWRTSRRSTAWAAVCGWALGVGGTLVWALGRPSAGVAVGPLLVALAASAACAIGLSQANRRTRRSSQAMRLAAIFLALLVPALAMYPSVFALTAQAKDRMVVTSYGPDIQSQRKDLQDRMRRTLDEIDALPALSGFLAPFAGDAVTTSDRAYRLWSQTDLAVHRLTSSVELYTADGRIASLFALNLPVSTATRYRAASCAWSVFDEESPFGAAGRNLLRASRGICEGGRIVGTIVVHAMLDYRTLPFGVSQSPYLASLLLNQEDAAADRADNDVEFAFYGWSRAPIYASGTSVWTLPDAAFDRMIESREALWASIDRDSQSFRVYLFTDRGGIYALGYPVITWFGHLVNLVELATLTLLLYVVLLAAATVLNVLTSRTPASGRALLREMRSSFYRKLFLYFVAGAVVPVAILALATRTYFAAQLRAGIDEAAAKTATVAQRLVEDYAALQQRGPGALDVIDDQIMLLVGQAIDQDVHLFNRARLQATSEPDLFESQVLSTRTPADVYRRILLDRLPTFVGEEAVGGVNYRIAAAPVRAGGREGIVTVPLALRDLEIEGQIDQLDHRVLFLAVLFSLLGAALGYWMAERIADPVNRLTRATRRIARGDLDARIAATSSDELRRLVEDFNQMAADLKRQRSELERTQRLEAWADMARQVAHDIKNPLTPIQLSAEHARRINIDHGRPLSPVLDECVGSILAQVRLLRRISAEFSSFGSSPTPEPAPTDLAALIEEVVSPYRAGLTSRVTIESVAAPDLPDVTIDRTLFARALTNVIENALHAMPGGGCLTVASRLSLGAAGPKPPAGPSPKPGTRSVVVEVNDTGVGMDQQALDRIFEPYFSTKATGTGLGLTIAKRNVELNGGTIEVASQRGAGTTVRLTLPA